MAFNQKVFLLQYPAVVFFVQRLAYYRGLSDAHTSGLKQQRVAHYCL
jgi:hypothetical protein